MKTIIKVRVSHEATKKYGNATQGFLEFCTLNESLIFLRPYLAIRMEEKKNTKQQKTIVFVL